MITRNNIVKQTADTLYEFFTYLNKIHIIKNERIKCSINNRNSILTNIFVQDEEKATQLKIYLKEIGISELIEKPTGDKTEIMFALKIDKNFDKILHETQKMLRPFKIYEFLNNLNVEVKDEFLVPGGLFGCYPEEPSEIKQLRNLLLPYNDSHFNLEEANFESDLNSVKRVLRNHMNSCRIIRTATTAFCHETLLKIDELETKYPFSSSSFDNKFE